MTLNQEAKQTEFAELVGASQPSISKYFRAGILKKGENYQTWLINYCEKLRTEAAGRELSASRQTLEQVKTREALANAQLKELDLYREHKLVLDVEQVKDAMEQWIAVARSEYENSIEKILTEIEDKYDVSIDRESITGNIESTCRTIGNFTIKS